MPKYVLQELPDEMTDGKKVLFPKMQTYTLHDFETVLPAHAHLCRQFQRGFYASRHRRTGTNHEELDASGT